MAAPMSNAEYAYQTPVTAVMRTGILPPARQPAQVSQRRWRSRALRVNNTRGPATEPPDHVEREAKERLSALLTKLDLPQPVLIDNAGYVTDFNGLQAHPVQNELPEDFTKLHKSHGAALPCGIFRDFSCLWWFQEDTLSIWHWPSPTKTSEGQTETHFPRGIYKLGFEELGVWCEVTELHIDPSLVSCLPDIPELQLANACATQLEPTGMLAGNSATIRFASMIVVTSSHIQKYVVAGNSQIGIIDALLVAGSRVTFDGTSLQCMKCLPYTDRAFLADKTGRLWEYTTSFIKQAYVEVNTGRGGRLEAIDPSLLSTSIIDKIGILGGSRGNRITTQGTVTKIIDVRRMTERFFGNYHILSLEVDENRGFIFALTNVSEVYLIFVPPPQLSFETIRNRTVIRIAECETQVRNEAWMTPTSLINSIVEMSTKTAQWGTPGDLHPDVFDQQPASSPSSNRYHTQFGGRQLGRYVKEMRAGLSKCIKIIGTHVIGGDTLLLVLDEGTRCFVRYDYMGHTRGWARGSGLEAAPAIGCRTLSRILDPQLWQLLHNRYQPMELKEMTAQLVSVRLPPPGLAEVSKVWKCIDEVRGTRRDGDENNLMRLGTVDVTRSWATTRCGGILILETRRMDGRTREEGEMRAEDNNDGRPRDCTIATVAVAPGLPMNSNYVSHELVKWLRNPATNDWFQMTSLKDLPLPEDLTHFESGPNLPALIYTIHHRLSCAMALPLCDFIMAESDRTTSILSEVLAFGPPIEKQHILTATGLVPGAQFMGLTDQTLMTISRVRPAHQAVAWVSNATAGICALHAEVVALLKLKPEIGCEVPLSIIRTLQQQTGQPLRLLNQWALLVQPDNQTARDPFPAESAALLAPEYRDAVLAIAWQDLARKCSDNIATTTRPNNTTQAMPSGFDDGSRQGLVDTTPIASMGVRQTNGACPAGAEVTATILLISMLPVLASFDSSAMPAAKPLEQSDPRFIALVKNILKILQPFFSMPMFEMEGGIPGQGVSLTRQDIRKVQTHSSSVTQNSLTAGSRPVVPDEDESRSRKRRAEDTLTPLNGNKRYQPQLSHNQKTDEALSELKSGGLKGPVDLRLKLRFTRAELRVAQYEMECLKAALERYEAHIGGVNTPELRKKLFGDGDDWRALRNYMRSAAELFAFFGALSDGLTRYSNHSGNVLAIGEQAIRLVDPVVFDSLATQTFHDYLHDVTTNGMIVSLRRWLESELDGGIVSLVSPSDLLKAAPNLFGPTYLYWQAALEPLRCLTTAIIGCEGERRALLHQQLTAKDIGSLSRPQSAGDRSTEPPPPEGGRTPRANITETNRFGSVVGTQLGRQQAGSTTPLGCQTFPTNGLMPQETISAEEEGGGVVPMLEYMWNEWLTSRPDLRKDLRLCLPLPSFLESGKNGRPNFDVFQEDAEGARVELRYHVMKAIFSLISLPQNGFTGESPAVETLVEALFELHCFDALALVIGVWCHYVIRGDSEWQNSRKPTEPIPKLVSEKLTALYERLKAVSDHTDDWLGRDLAETMVVQFTQMGLPALGTLYTWYTSKCAQMGQPTNISEVDNFCAAFDISRATLEEGMAHATFFWMVSNGGGGSYPRPLGSLQSHWLMKWLEKLPMATQANAEQYTAKVAIAVADFYLTEQNFARAQEHLERLILDHPRWLTNPPDRSALAGLSVKNAKEIQPRRPYPLKGPSMIRELAEIDLHETFKEVFIKKWFSSSIETDWKMSERFYQALRRLGDLPLDVRQQLVDKAEAASEGSKRSHPLAQTFNIATPIPAADPLSEIRLKVYLQNEALNDSLLCICMMTLADEDLNLMLFELIMEFGGNPKVMVQRNLPVRKLLVSQTMSFVVSLLHTIYKSFNLLFDTFCNYMLSLRGFLPFPSLTLYEIYLAMPAESRRQLSLSALSRAFPGLQNADMLVEFASFMPSWEFCVIMIKVSRGLGVYEHTAYRLWNIFADHSTPRRRDLLLPREHEPPACTASVVAFLLLDRVNRRHYAQEQYGPLLDRSLIDYFVLPQQSHIERLRKLADPLGVRLDFGAAIPIIDGVEPVVGCVTGFAYEAIARAYFWDLISLVRSPETGSRLANVTELTLNPSRILAVAYPMCVWSLGVVEGLNACMLWLNRGAGGSDPKRNPLNVMEDMITQMRSFSLVLDQVCPLKHGTVPHMSLAEVIHCFLMSVQDLVRATEWFVRVGLPCFDLAERLTGPNSVVVLTGIVGEPRPAQSLKIVNEQYGEVPMEAVTFFDALNEWKKNSAIKVTPDLTAMQKAENRMKDHSDDIVRVTGWRNLAFRLMRTAQRALLIWNTDVYLEAIRTERRQDGASHSVTHLESLMQQINHQLIRFEKQIVPALATYNRLLDLYADTLSRGSLFGPLRFQ